VDGIGDSRAGAALGVARIAVGALTGVDKVGVDKVGVDKVGVDKVGVDKVVGSVGTSVLGAAHPTIDRAMTTPSMVLRDQQFTLLVVLADISSILYYI
jgi:hypothetical protein